MQQIEEKPEELANRSSSNLVLVRAIPSAQ
jgi:hypothetical protein